MWGLLHVLAIICEVHQLHTMTTGTHKDEVCLLPLQKCHLVGEDHCPAPHPATIAATVVAVVVVVDAHRARPYVYIYDCAHSHVQTEAP